MTREQLAEMVQWIENCQEGDDDLMCLRCQGLLHQIADVARAGLADTERLDVLINWLGFHDDLEGSGIRDWDGSADAREAIDESIRKRSGLVASPKETDL